MKRIRIGKDLDCRLTVLTNGETVSLEDDSLVLVMVNPDNSKQKVGVEYVENNVIHFHVSPAIQNTTGVYGFEVWKNIGSGCQSVCDCVRAFELVRLSPMEGGMADPDLTTDSVDMEADFSNEYIVIDNLDSYLENVALSANQGRILNDKIKKEVAKRQTLITFDEDENYVAKIVDSEGNLLIGFKESGEVVVPTGLTDDAYELIEALYKKLRDNTSVLTEAVEDITVLGQYADKTFETKTDAETAHKELQSSIGNEASARTAADSTLQDNIDALAKDVSNTYETKEDAASSHEALEESIEKKQDKLTAGTGIDITDNTVSCTLDTNPFVFVDELPTSDVKTGKVYCTPDPESTDEKNIWDEWYWIENEQRWEAVGKYIPTVDLTPYEKIEDAEAARKELQEAISTETSERTAADTALQSNIDKLASDVSENYQPKGDYATKSEIPTKVSELTNDSGYITSAALGDYETASDAEEAHKELQTSIDNEAKAREEADTTLQTNIDKKQDKLTAGAGIDITDNIISSTVDTNPFVFVDALPTEGIVEGKIYCIPDPESTEEDNVWDEYTYHDGAWEAMGKYIPTVDLTPYEKIEDAEAAHKKLQEDIDTEVANRTALIEETEDETYVTKMVDAEGNLLLGFKEGGEIEVPTGVTDDSYNLIEALYRKLKETVSSITETKEELQENIDDEVKNRTALIEETDDDTYVMKQVDNDGNLLIGVKSNGEVEMPTGIPDETAAVIEALAGKVAEMAEYLKEIQ